MLNLNVKYILNLNLLGKTIYFANLQIYNASTKIKACKHMVCWQNQIIEGICTFIIMKVFLMCSLYWCFRAPLTVVPSWPASHEGTHYIQAIESAYNACFPEGLNSPTPSTVLLLYVWQPSLDKQNCVLFRNNLYGPYWGELGCTLSSIIMRI